jgi:hypothetical protein
MNPSSRSRRSRVARTLKLLSLALFSTLGLAACGGGDSGGTGTGAIETVSPEAKEACAGSPLAGTVKLPSGFPQPSGVTYVKQSESGPTTIVDGRFAGTVEEGYDAYLSAVKDAGYTVLFNEREGEDDAEVSYEAGATSGQIALRNECGEADKTYVHITNRPA